MKNLQDATERICELKGSLIALDAMLVAMLQTLPPEVRSACLGNFRRSAEVAQVFLVALPETSRILGAHRGRPAREPPGGVTHRRRELFAA